MCYAIIHQKWEPKVSRFSGILVTLPTLAANKGQNLTWATETSFYCRETCDAALENFDAVFQDGFIEDIKKNFDSNQIVLALDFKVINETPKIYTHGWQNTTDISLYEFLSDQSFFLNILATDISLDGAMQGPSFDIYEHILNTFPLVNLIASGGIRSLDDLDSLKTLKIKEAIIGKAIYEKNISLEDLNNDY